MSALNCNAPHNTAQSLKAQSEIMSSPTVELSPSAHVKDQKSAGRGVFASTLIPAGTEILSIPDPLLCIPDDVHLDHVCHYCMAEATETTSSVSQAFKPPVNLSYCLGCRVVKYCSKTCQATDWKRRGHSYECPIYKAQYPRILPTTARAILRMAKLFLTETISANMIGGIGALKTHVTEFDKAGGERWEMINLTAKATSEFSKGSKKENFEAEFMRDLYCKLMVNSLTVTTQTFDPIGVAVEYKAAMFNHSCDRNAIMLFDGRSLSVRSLREIPKDTEITISYIDVHGARKERRAELRDRYFFDCTCSLCSSDVQPLEASSCHECRKLVPSNASACPSCSAPVSEELDSSLALAESISAAREKKNADKSIPVTLKSLKSLYATKVLPSTYHPIPQLHYDLATAYIDEADWKSAFLHLLTLYVKVFPVIYETPYHPIRVVRTFTLAMVLIQVAVVAPEGFDVELDYSKLLYGLLIEVCGNVDKSHGEDSGFAKTVKRKMEEVKVDVGIDSNREADKWMGKGLKGVPGLEAEVGKISKIVDGFAENLRE